jgi:mycofactocin precursor
MCGSTDARQQDDRDDHVGRDGKRRARRLPSAGSWPAARVGNIQIMTRAPATTSCDNTEAPSGETSDDDSVVESDLLVEEISIDGMCGVY